MHFIASHLPEIRKMLRDHGLLTKPNDPEDLADKDYRGNRKFGFMERKSE